MFGRLKYNAEFVSGMHRSLSNDIDLSTGLTCITGPNESGKSMILEMLRYGLFGAEALRGAVKDYKKIEVDEAFTVKGRNYRVVRTLRDATLYEDDTPTAKGTKPVNARIIEIFGYGLNVFDTAHVCNQSEIEKLSDMKPNERRQMVDRVIGLSAIDGLAKWLNDTALDHSRQADALNEQLIVPVQPELPVGLRPIEVIEAEIDATSRLVAHRNELAGWLSQVRVDPTKPVNPGINRDMKSLQKELECFERKQALQRKLAGYPVSLYTQTQLDELKEQHQAFAAYQEFLARGPRPTMTLAQVDHQEEVLADYARWQAHKRMKDQGDIECPHCKESFAIVEEIRHLTIPDAMEKPGYTQQFLNTERKAIAAWSGFVGPDLEPVKNPILSLPQIEVEAQKIALAAERDAIELEIAGLGDPRDVSADIRALTTFQMQSDSYAAAAVEYLAYIQERSIKQAAFDDLYDASAVLITRTVERDTAMRHANDVAAYEKQKELHDAMIIRIDEQREKEAAYRTAGKAVKELRSRVKEYLVPSLNRVASHLLRVMTGGKRASVTIDEDFNITIDSQPLHTLSGSGKSVANLAIRLGLGQVLTNRVFPVFMGDEIDAAMDADRAGNTAECLKNLTSSITQVVLVSHKTLEADNYIDTGDANANGDEQGEGHSGSDR